MSLKTNSLYYGDNLKILREYIPDESVDLIYLDPPFNSKRDYNVIFKEEDIESEAQIGAFTDSWKWGIDAEKMHQEIIQNAPINIAQMVDSFIQFLGRNDVTAYLVMMTPRLIELRRVLKPTGSIYLHCDPTASHYLKVLMDQIFIPKNFLNEVVWYYRGAGISPKYFGKRHDILLFYAKDRNKYFFNPDEVRDPYAEATIERFKHHIGNVRGKSDYGVQTLNPKGKHPDDVWSIQPIAPSAKERLGYPTQKPVELLEKIIKASSKKGDIILDPFCGCGTTLVAAQKLGRKWVGIDITHLAVGLMRKRLKDLFAGVQIEVIGEPEDLSGATELAKDNRYQFEWWAVDLTGARPAQDKKKGSDRGVDGVILFEDGGMQKVIIQIKSGKVNSSYIRDLKGALEREKAAIGTLVTLNSSTAEMTKEAASSGFYHSKNWDRDFPKLQIITIKELLDGKKIDMPPFRPQYRVAESATTETESMAMDL